MEISSDENVLHELTRAMRFSEIFFDAFAITRDRAAQWQFISILLRLEVEGKIGYLKLRADKECREVIDSLDYLTPDHALKVLIGGWRDEKGPLIELPTDGKKDRIIRFNKQFEEAAKRFVEAFRSKLGFPDGGLPHMPPIEGMKVIFRVLKEDYYPVWLALVTRFGRIWRPDDPHEARDLYTELVSKAPYWTVLVAVWRKALGDSKISTDESGLWRATFDSMRGADPDELKACIAYLSKKDGPKILLRTRENRLDLYALNPAYKDPFIWYGDEICRLNRSLGAKLLALGSSPTAK